MIERRHWPVWLLLLAALAGCADQAQQRAGTRVTADGRLGYGAITFDPCALDGNGLASVEAHCATVQVPENPAAPEGRHIDLALALIPADGMAEADPVFMITGGPGQSALESYPTLAAAFRDVRRKRHVLLLDARGTGGSHPLQCPKAELEQLLAGPREAMSEAMRAYTKRCRDTLAAQADLRQYTTAAHVRDLEHVRSLLGAEHINLIGISYGTRVAQQYAAAHPRHTRSLVLDSVVPNTLVLGQEHARNLEDALDAQFERCRRDAACSRALGDPRAQLTQVRERLQAGNLPPVRYRDPVSGEWIEDVPTFGHLASLLRMYPYQPATAATMPLLLHEAAQGRYESLLAQSRMLTRQMSDAIAMGMSLSVSCSEDVAEFKADPANDGTVLGDEFVTELQAQCALWPKGERADSFRTPLSGPVPVLAISGEHDPVTPARYGDAVIESLPNGRHLVLPGQGHGMLGTGCMPKLVAQFLETADAAALDAQCLDRLTPQPPFAGPYGWEP